MLAIKLQRVGKKHQSSYRLVVAERRSKMAAPPVEDLGAYHPSGKTATFNKDRIAHWIKMGAQPTVTVHNLLVGQGIISAPTMAVKMKKKAAAETAPAATATPAEPAAATESAPKTAPVDATPAA